jgi:hypothetical protein
MIHEDIDFYKGLAIYILPDGVTNYFDLVDFSEEPARKGAQLYKTELHLYLDERDNRPEGFAGIKPNGFTEEKQILDFPDEELQELEKQREFEADLYSFSS